MSETVLSQRPVYGSYANILRKLIAHFFIFFAAVLIVVTPATAAAPRSYAGIVVDAKTGNTLYSYAADSARYPASVTKVMTLYVLFQELEAGRLRLSTRMTVSRHATQAVPSKLNLRAGSTIKVEDAIKALVTKSANDVARVIAEHISGSESAFARRMTATARALGMSRTTYANASGLHNSRQVTTVRDQAKLGMAIFQHFPGYYEYFQTRSFTYAGNTYGNHNRLLGERGVDGIKTGYTRASGFNLLTAARQNNRHIVVVGFGFDSGNARNAKVRDLIRRYMDKARRGSYWRQAAIPKIGAQGAQNNFAVAANTPVTPAPLPAWRNVTSSIVPVISSTPITATTLVASIPASALNVQSAPLPAPLLASRAVHLPPTSSTSIVQTPIAIASLEPPVELIPSPNARAQQGNQANTIALIPPTPVQTRPNDILGQWISNNFNLDANHSNPAQVSGVRSLLPPANIGTTASIGSSANQAIDLMTSGSVNTTPTPTNSDTRSYWVVQIGAPHSQEIAQTLLNTATQRIGELNNFRSYIERFEKTGQTFYRARFTGFDARSGAISMCEQIKQNNMSCLAVQS